MEEGKYPQSQQHPENLRRRSIFKLGRGDKFNSVVMWKAWIKFSAKVILFSVKGGDKTYKLCKISDPWNSNALHTSKIYSVFQQLLGKT